MTGKGIAAGFRLVVTGKGIAAGFRPSQGEDGGTPLFYNILIFIPVFTKKEQFFIVFKQNNKGKTRDMAV